MKNEKNIIKIIMMFSICFLYFHLLNKISFDLYVKIMIIFYGFILYYITIYWKKIKKMEKCYKPLTISEQISLLVDQIKDLEKLYWENRKEVWDVESHICALKNKLIRYREELDEITDSLIYWKKKDDFLMIDHYEEKQDELGERIDDCKSELNFYENMGLEERRNCFDIHVKKARKYENLIEELKKELKYLKDTFVKVS